MTLDDAAVETLLARAAEEVDSGALPACQLALAVDGEVVFAHSLGAPEAARFSVFSITKAVTAAAVWGAMSDGLLTAETRVADVLPAFAQNGKDAVTVAHVMTHTGGFPRAPMKPADEVASASRLARMAGWRLDWEPGTQTEYHAISAHWVLAELLEQLTGTDFRAYVRSRVLDPLGLSRLQLGVPVPSQGDVLDVVMVGSVPADGPPQPAFAADEHTVRFNEPAVREVGIPGGGVVSDASSIALLYQAFLRDRGTLWDPAVLAEGTAHVRNTFVDPMTGVPANRTLGLAVAGSDGKAAMRELGRSVGPRAFGAPGLGGQIAWADPDSGLSFCYLTNGIERNVVTTFLRSSRIATLAGRVLP